MRLLCYGDSNTYGYDPRSFFGDRYPKESHWVDNKPITPIAIIKEIKGIHFLAIVDDGTVGSCCRE